MHWFYLLSGVVFFLGILGFSITSFRELEKRAGLLSLLCAVGFGIIWAGIGIAFPEATFYLAVIAWALSVAGAIFLSLPIGKAEPLKIDISKTERFDERHIMFGRMELKEGTPQYDEYYMHLNPEMKKVDDNLRSMPDLGEPGAKYFNLPIWYRFLSSLKKSGIWLIRESRIRGW